MDDAKALRFPDSKTLASWWRQLQPHHPHALWIGYCYLHRLEVPAVAEQAVPLDQLSRLLLETLRLANSRTANTWPAFPAGVLNHLLGLLSESGAVERCGSQWKLTQAGHDTLTRGTLLNRRIERRRFTLAERIGAGGGRHGPPMPISIAEGRGEPWEIPAELRLDLGQARAALASLGSLAELPARDWESVIVDHGERHRLALVQTESRVSGYSFSADSWRLESQAAELGVDLPAEALWPDCCSPSIHDLQSAWASWHQSAMSAPAPPADLHLGEYALEVEVKEPSPMLVRALADGEAWVLVGQGYFRRALQLRGRK